MYWWLYYGGVAGLTMLVVKNHWLQQRVITTWMAHYDEPCAYSNSHHPDILTTARAHLRLGWVVYAILLILVITVCPTP